MRRRQISNRNRDIRRDLGRCISAFRVLTTSVVLRLTKKVRGRITELRDLGVLGAAADQHCDAYTGIANSSARDPSRVRVACHIPH